MKILLVNEPSRLYVKCEECNEEDGFYVEESILLHAECVEPRTLSKLLEKVTHN